MKTGYEERNSKKPKNEDGVQLKKLTILMIDAHFANHANFSIFDILNIFLKTVK